MPLVWLAGTWGGALMGAGDRDSLVPSLNQTLGRFPSYQVQARAAAPWCGAWTCREESGQQSRLLHTQCQWQKSQGHRCRRLPDGKPGRRGLTEGPRGGPEGAPLPDWEGRARSGL